MVVDKYSCGPGANPMALRVADVLRNLLRVCVIQLLDDVVPHNDPAVGMVAATRIGAQPVESRGEDLTVTCRTYL